MLFERATINLDEETRRRLIFLLDEDLKHGQGTSIMSDLLSGLMECDEVVLET